MRQDHRGRGAVRGAPLRRVCPGARSRGPQLRQVSTGRARGPRAPPLGQPRAAMAAQGLDVGQPSPRDPNAPPAHRPDHLARRAHRTHRARQLAGSGWQPAAEPGAAVAPDGDAERAAGRIGQPRHLRVRLRLPQQGVVRGDARGRRVHARRGPADPRDRGVEQRAAARRGGVPPQLDEGADRGRGFRRRPARSGHRPSGRGRGHPHDIDR